MIDVEIHAEGAILPVHAQSGGRMNGLRGEQAGALKVSVTQVAEKGKANKAIIEVLAESLDFRRSQIELVAGDASVHKRFLIRGVSVETLHERLRAALTTHRERE